MNNICHLCIVGKNFELEKFGILMEYLGNPV
jgi:hypothetical protein